MKMLNQSRDLKKSNEFRFKIGRCGVDKLTQTPDSVWLKLWIQYLAPPMHQCSTKNQTQIPVFDITFLERNTLELAVN